MRKFYYISVIVVFLSFAILNIANGEWFVAIVPILGMVCNIKWLIRDLKAGDQVIKFSNKTIDRTIKYLNDNYPLKEDIYIKVAEGFDVVEDPETGERGFGAFHTEHKVIFVASCMEKEELIRTIAHEYRHAMQLFNNEDFNEDVANEFADKILKELEREENG